MFYPSYIGYHGIYHLGREDSENITMTNNYLDGAGITRQWSTFAVWNTGGLNVLIGNNEVTRTSGGGIHVISESFKKGLLIYNSAGFNIENQGTERTML